MLVHPSDGFAIGVTYVHSAVIENTGDVLIDFECPPDSDSIGRAIASSHGVCGTRVTGEGTSATRCLAACTAA